VRSLYERLNCFTAKCYWNERWSHPIEKEEGKRNYAGFEEELKFGLSQGMEVKGHPLFWTVNKALPEWLLKYPVKDRLQKMLDHTGDMVTRYKDRIHLWDVCNEFLWEPSLNHTEQRVWPHLETIPEILTYLEPGMKHIRKQDPSARLVLNEYGLEKDFTKGVTAKHQRQRYLELVAEMKKRNCAPDAIGTQCHVGEPFTMEEIQTSLDELAMAGLPLQITEFWARTPGEKKEKVQADEKTLEYIRNAYTIGFGHPSVELFTYWGSDLVSESGELGPKGKVVLDLLSKEWTTREAFQTNGKGEFSGHAFFGEYVLMKGGKEIKRFRFGKESEKETLEIVL
jgi:GH35 family endo-1,4-beta-xylanase